MLPFGGQGSNQAIEDTGALRCLFENVEPGESLMKSLELFDRVRRIRVTRTQTMSKVRVGKEREVREELLRYADPPGSRESCHDWCATRERYVKTWFSGAGDSCRADGT